MDALMNREVLLLIVSLLLSDCHGVTDPALTSQPMLTYNMTLPDRMLPVTDYISTNSLLLLPDNGVLIGAETRTAFAMRLLSLGQAGSQARMEVLDEFPGNVKSLALLSNGMVAMTKQDVHKNNTIYILEVGSGERARVVSTIPIGRRKSETVCCPIVAPGPQDNTLLLAMYDYVRDGTTIQVMSINGTVLDTIVEELKFDMTHMAVYKDIVYISGMDIRPDVEIPLLKLDLQSRTISRAIGDLNLEALHDYSFFQGSFDGRGNFYVATFDYASCLNRNRDENTCCRCVMVITPEGRTRVLYLSPPGLPEFELRNVDAVVTTPSGFGVASLIVKNKGYRVFGWLSEIQFYDLD